MTERRIPAAKRLISVAQSALDEAMEYLEASPPDRPPPPPDRPPVDPPPDPPRDHQMTPEERRRKYLRGQDGDGRGQWDELQAPTIDPVTEVDVEIGPGDSLEEAVVEALKSTLHPVIGVRGKNPGSLRLAVSNNYGVRGDIRLTLVGLDEHAEIRGATIGSNGGFVHELELRGLKLATPKGQRAAIKDVGEWGRILIHHCGLLPDPSYPNNYGGAGMKWGIHLSDGEQLHIQDCYRAKRHEDGAPVRYEEHWGYFLDIDIIYIVGNDLAGGNRTGFQIRTPGDYGTLDGQILIADNKCADYGWEWQTKNGGSAITVWENLGVTEIRNNVVTNAKYGCLALAQQPPSQKPTLNPHGFPMGRVVVHGNTLTNPQGDRACGSMSAVDALFVFTGVFDGGGNTDLVIDDPWSLNNGAKRCLAVTLGDGVTEDVRTWDGSGWAGYPL